MQSALENATENLTQNLHHGDKTMLKILNENLRHLKYWLWIYILYLNRNPEEED